VVKKAYYGKLHHGFAFVGIAIGRDGLAVCRASCGLKPKKDRAADERCSLV